MIIHMEFLLKNLKERANLGNVRIIVKRILKGIECECLYSIQLAQDWVHRRALANMINESSVSIKGKEFLDKLSNCHFLKKDSLKSCFI